MAVAPTRGTTPLVPALSWVHRRSRRLWPVGVLLAFSFFRPDVAQAQTCIDDGGTNECVDRIQLPERFHPGNYSSCPTVPQPPAAPAPYVGRFATEDDAMDNIRNSLICGYPQAFCQLPTPTLHGWGSGVTEPGFEPKWQCRTGPSGTGGGITWDYQTAKVGGTGCNDPATKDTSMCVDRPMLCPPGFSEIPTSTRVLCAKPKPACCELGGGPTTRVGNPISIAAREKEQEETDALLPAEFGIKLSRLYNSGGLLAPVYSTGTRMTQLDGSWTLSFDHRLSLITSPVTGKQVARLYRADRSMRYFFLETGGWVGLPDEPGTFITLLDGGGAVVGYRYRTTNDIDEDYSLSGRLTRLDRQGLVTTFDYDSGNRLAAIHSPSGRTVTFDYIGASERVSSVTLPDGTAVSYTYGEFGDIQSVSLPGGAGRSYSYASNRAPLKLAGITDENGINYAQFGYTSADSASSTQYNGGVNRYVITPIDGVSMSVEDPLGGITRYYYQTYAKSQRLIQRHRTCPGCATDIEYRTYDANGLPNLVIDYRGNITDHDYGPRALETQRVEASNVSGASSPKRTIQTVWHSSYREPVERRTYNAAGTLEAKSQWVYNARGQVTARCEIDPADSLAMSYSCSATTAPAAAAKVRRWTYDYCEAADVAAPGSTCPLLGLPKITNGPRATTDSGMGGLDDITTYSYYAATDETGCATVGGTCHRKGDLQTVTNALGQTTEYLAYDKMGRATRTRDANGTITDLSYNARGWLTQRTVRALASGSADANDATTAFSYDNVGQVTRVTQPDGVYLDYVYDNAHRLTDVVDTLGNRLHYTLDNAGNRVKEETFDATYNPGIPGQGLKRALARQYNTLGRLVRELNAANAATRDSTPYDSGGLADGYDPNGNAVQFKDGLNVQAQQTYDALNRLVKTIQDYTGTDPETGNATTEYTYDARDNLRTVKDPDNLTTTYTYDGLGNQTALDSPDTGHTDYAYDRAGNRVSQTDNRGTTSSYTYDSLGRLVGIGYPTSVLDVAFHYDEGNGTTGCASSYPQGRLTRMTDATGSTTYCYDRRGNVIGKTQVTAGETLAVAYSHTLADSVSTITYPSGGLATYGYDAAGRVNLLTWKESPSATTVTVVSGISYYPFGPANVLTYGNGRTLTKTYDQDYQIDSVASSVTDGLKLDFGRDVMANITSASGTLGASPPDRSYVYDKLYRLTQVNDSTGAMLEDYNYTKTGDRTLKQFAGQPAQTYAYLVGTHRLGSVAGTARTYDANGNTTDRGDGVTLGYDDRNRLASAAVTGNATTYDYSGRGERTYKVQASGGTPVENRYLYNESGQILLDRRFASASGNTASTEYLFIDALPIAVSRTTGLSYLETDHLGTPRVAANPNTNAKEWSWDLLGKLFGEDFATSFVAGKDINLRYPGQWQDAETQLFQNYFRDYDPLVGRYIQSDPVGLNGGGNTYLYVEASPIGAVDPDGLGPIKLIKLCVGGYKTIRNVSFWEAVKIVRKGSGEIKASSHAEARKIARAASRQKKPIRDPVHPDPITGSIEGRMPHYHPSPRTGVHVFYSISAALSLANYSECEDCTKETLFEVLDFFNPLSTGEDVLDIIDEFE